MVGRLALRLIVLIGTLGLTGVALAEDRLQAYLNDTALQVRATESPVQKREILSHRLGAMIKALDSVQSAPLTSERDEVSLARLSATLQEKNAELAGTDGFDRVPDDQLNAFSTYIVQDAEQADQTVTISVVTLLLILIIVLLVA